MPILASEPFVHPEGLFLEPDSLQVPQRRWWVLHTRPRAEKALSRIALRKEVPFFLPLHVHRWRNKGRLFKSSLPLFPGYLFIHADDEERMKLHASGSVANMLPVSDQVRLHNDLMRVYSLMTSCASLSPEPILVTGARVRITAGPFRGLEGTIIRKGKQLRLLLEVHFMQQGVSVEIESWMVAPVVAAAS